MSTTQPALTPQVIKAFKDRFTVQQVEKELTMGQIASWVDGYCAQAVYSSDYAEDVFKILKDHLLDLFDAWEEHGIERPEWATKV